MRTVTGTLLALLALAAALPAQDDEGGDGAVRRLGDLVDEGRFRDAIETADRMIEAGDERPVVAEYRAKARVGIARRLQRERSHVAAAEYLEQHLDHPHTAWGYARASLAAGRELEAAKQLRAHGVGRYEEIDLLYRRGHWREALERAHRYERPEWIAWLEREIAQRERLLGRGRRAWTVTVVALLVVAAGAFALWRFAPKASPSRARVGSG